MDTLSGKISEIIFAHFAPKEDLRQGLLNVIKQKDIKSGVILSITGALEKANLCRFASPQKDINKPKVEYLEIPGPLEVSGHGFIGKINAPAFGKEAWGPGNEFVHGQPYLHVHLTVTSGDQTVCGHLMDGSTVWTTHSISHFTVILGRIEGAGIQFFGEPIEGGGCNFGHKLIKL